MKSIVPYTKNIEFTSKIAEICSISLEHELNLGASDIEGTFIVSGEYKSHEVSINKEPFNYKLPFTLEITEDIIKESIDFEITDFTYEILKDQILKVNIEFCVTAVEKEHIEEATIEEIPKIEETQNDDELENSRNFEQEEIKESVIEEINNLFPSEDENSKNPENEEKAEQEERIDVDSQNIIMNSIEENSSEFATYQIHIVSSNDSVESICAMYQTDVETLKSYNSIEAINVGDKIIIPCLDE